MSTPVRARHLCFTASCCTACAALALGAFSSLLNAQVFTVNTNGRNGHAPEFHQTHIELRKEPLDERTRLELIRALESEQGFAMRAIPMGHKGLVLRANGKLENGEDEYFKELHDHGMAANAGDRVMITDLLVEKDRIVLLLNGGPDHKHRFLRHLSLGNSNQPVVRDDADPTGARLTLAFEKYVPQMTGQDVMDLLHPLIQFELKVPKEAYTDTLPPRLREAILNHQVLVGMNRKMVYAALGQPKKKVREQENGLVFEEWIYGEPPKETNFVRFSGDRVVRTETAELGKAPVVRATDETDGYLSSAAATEREVKLGDKTDADSDAGHPTLLAPGEKVENTNSPQRVKLPPNIDKPREAPPDKPE